MQLAESRAFRSGPEVFTGMNVRTESTNYITSRRCQTQTDPLHKSDWFERQVPDVMTPK